MKTPVIALFAAIFLLGSCTLFQQQKQAPLATAEMAQRSGTSLAQLQLGFAAYQAHCGRCHEHQLPKSVNSADWHVVVPGMAWNAGMSKTEERAVLAYLLAAKSEP